MGNASNHAVTTKDVQTHGNGHLKAAAASMMGCRDTMEDAHCMQCTAEYDLFGVFDGHAGSECASYCATHLGRELQKHPLPLDPEALTQAVLDLDTAVLGQTRAGSTACFAIATCVSPGQFALQIANVGDSRCLVGRNGGAECAVLTTDHRPSNKTERQRIERCGGFVEADRVDGMLGVARALGDGDFKRGRGGPLDQKVTAQPDITHTTCTAGDLVVIACDGVFEGNFRNAEVMRFIRATLRANGNDLSHAAAAVCDEALRRGSTDNITCMIVQFADGPEVEPWGSPSTLPRTPSSGSLSRTKRACHSAADRAGSTLHSVRGRFRAKAPNSGPFSPISSEPHSPVGQDLMSPISSASTTRMASCPNSPFCPNSP